MLYQDKGTHTKRFLKKQRLCLLNKENQKMSRGILAEIIKIKNKPMFNIGRAADLLWIHFGQSIIVKNHRGFEVEKGDYAIHVQCPWRFIQDYKLILGSGDVYIPREGISDSEFDWNTFGMSIFDEKLKMIKSKNTPIVVEDVSIDEVGTLKIIFERGLVFETLPNSSVTVEYWIFINNRTKKHTVVFE